MLVFLGVSHCESCPALTLVASVLLLLVNGVVYLTPSRSQYFYWRYVTARALLHEFGILAVEGYFGWTLVFEGSHTPCALACALSRSPSLPPAVA